MQATPVSIFARAATAAALPVAFSALSSACGEPPETRSSDVALCSLEYPGHASAEAVAESA